MRVFFRDKLAVVGVAWIVFMIVVAVVGALDRPLPGAGPRRSRTSSSRFEAPSAQHLFGTDNLGRDVLSPRHLRRPHPAPDLVGRGRRRAAHRRAAGRRSPATSAAGSTRSIMRITDIFLAFPALDPRHGVRGHPRAPACATSPIAIILTWWPWYTRLVRGMAVSLRERPYVEAAKTMGVSRPHHRRCATSCPTPSARSSCR